MKKSIEKKLLLNKRTIVNLDKKSMGGLFGGTGDEDVTETDSCPNSCIRTLCNEKRTENDCPLTR